ncbi:MAG: PHP domain-containing protein [Bacillota bacterium]|nr:PHP domain-containing protein [Bacillota bacterium]
MIVNTDEYKYKIELHAHSKPVSECSDIPPEELVETYKELGYNAVVLTNHFQPVQFEKADKKSAVERYLNDFYKAKSEGEKIGLSVLLGMEIRFVDSKNDYLVYGLDVDDVLKAADYVNIDIGTFYKEFKNEKNVILQAHPFRNGMTLAPKKSLDGIEVFNFHPNHNSRIGFAAKYAKENGYIIAGGSDFHHEGQAGQCSMLSKTNPKDSFDIASILKSGDYLFDIWGCKIII